MEIAKVTAVIDELVKNTKDADVLRGLQEIKTGVEAMGKEAEELEKAKKELDENNRKLVEGLKKAVISGGSKANPGEDDNGSPNPKPARSFEEILAEKIKEAADKGDKKEKK